MESRVTKYDPKFRGDQGIFRRDEWTSISDVGKVYDGQVFLMSDYIEVEEKYIDAVLLFLKTSVQEKVTITDLENNSIDKDDPLASTWLDLADGAIISVDQLPNLLRLILREQVWCIISSIEGNVEVQFGYDYYMSFHSDYDHRHIIAEIHRLGLFVE